MELTKLNPQMPPSQTNHRDDTVSQRKPPINLQAYDPFRHSNIIRPVSYLIILAVVAYIATVHTFWPSDPDVNIMRLTLRHVRVHSGAHSAVDVSMNATVEVNKRAMYSLDYNTLHVAVSYKGKELGNVTSSVGGHVSLMGSSHLDATVEVDGIEVDSDDLAKGFIQLDTLAKADGFLFFMQIPLKAKYSCEIDVDVKEQKVSLQDCYPVVIEIGFGFTVPIPFTEFGQLQVNFVLRF